MKIKVYDFDKTIYDGDSTLDFYKHCLKKHIRISIYLPIQILYIFLYKARLIHKEKAKEKFFIFLKDIENIDLELKLFWNKNFKKIKKWYIDKVHENDIIISASPEFLLQIPSQRLKVKKLIASKVDKTNGRFLSANCYGEEKLKRLKKELKNFEIIEAYSDSLSDRPLLENSKYAYLVKKNKIKNYIK